MLDSISQVVDVNNRVVSVILNEYVQSARAFHIELRPQKILCNRQSMTV